MKYAFLAGLLSLAFTTMPGHAQDLGDSVSQPGVFSYQAPKGWTVKDTAISKYKISFDAPKNNFSANINVVVESYPKSLSEYVELNKTALKTAPVFQNLQIIDEKPFETSSGVKGTRLVVKDTMGKVDMQQIFYFFEGASDAKLVVTASCLVGDGDHYTPLFDASLKTFSPK